MLKSLANMNIKQNKLIKQTLKQMVNGGAKITELPGEDLVLVQCTYGDKAWDFYEDWADKLETDLHVTAGFAPSENIMNSTLCPPEALSGGIVREANSIVRHYVPLRRHNFSNGLPLIPVPLVVNVQNTPIHVTIALSKLMQAIQNPQKNYPNLFVLKSGSYICTVTHVWANASVEIKLYK